MYCPGLVPKVSNVLILFVIFLICYLIDVMLNGMIRMAILQDDTPTNLHVLLSQLWIRTDYGMTMALLATSWYVKACYQNPVILIMYFSAIYPWISSC